MSMKQQGLEQRIRSFVERIRREDVNLHGFILTVDGQEAEGHHGNEQDHDGYVKAFGHRKNLLA